MGDFIPQNPSLGTRFQTPSSHYELHIPKKNSCRKATAQSGSRELSSLVGFGAKPQPFSQSSSQSFLKTAPIVSNGREKSHFFA